MFINIVTKDEINKMNEINEINETEIAKAQVANPEINRYFSYFFSLSYLHRLCLVHYVQ